MITITLESIKAEQSKLAALIAQFEEQIPEFHFPETLITMRPGEHYAGLIVGKDGEASYHLILMAGIPTADMAWQAAKDWAKLLGGELPTRREQSLLFANLKEQFEERYYWSCEQHESDAGYAWFQHFISGDQIYDHVLNELRARAVRRVAI
jgi:hypothetical protein